MEQIKKTWIVSPMVRNTTRQANQTHDKRPTSETIIFVDNTDNKTCTKWMDWLEDVRNIHLTNTQTASTGVPEQATVPITE